MATHEGPGRVDILEVEIERMNAAGDGVARHRGREIVVPFTIPGERVRVRPRADRGGNSLTATPEAILRPSPHRIEPRCRHFGPGAEPGAGPCGGCSWQHIAYAEQLRLKTELVTRLVRNAVRKAPAALPMRPALAGGEPWGYRHKAHFVFGPLPRNGGLAMGHHVRGSRRVIPIRECPVHDARGNDVAFRLLAAFRRAGVDAVPDGPLKSVAIRAACGTSQLSATLVLAREADKRLRAATRRAIEGAGATLSFHVNLHPRADAFIFGARTRTIAGDERMRETVAGTSFLVSPTAFFQTNVHAAELLVALVLESVPAGARVLDLYAGAGLFALPLARRGHLVVAVEANRQAVSDGEASRRLNRVPDNQCPFIARPVELALGRRETRGPFDVVVLDPPREGCTAPVIRQVFGALAPASAVYISCNPEALARDLAAITALGYRIRAMQPVDMFPHTAHVETVVTLDRITGAPAL